MKIQRSTIAFSLGIALAGANLLLLLFLILAQDEPAGP